jgi:hypothetical protein
LISAIISELAKALIVKPLVASFMSGLGNLFGGGGVPAAGTSGLGYVGASMGESTANFLGGAAEGGIWPTMLAHFPINSYDSGGVANSPQIGIFGEAGQEAFVPLKSGKIPVQMKGEGKGGGKGDTYVTYIQATDVNSFAKMYGPTIESIYFKGQRYSKVAMRK